MSVHVEATRPWYQRTYRWGQTNITEKDSERYDIDWWRGHWRRTRVQGVIINAAGIVFYYPTRHHPGHEALYLRGRDLYGEICRAAREEGLAVIARMDSNRVHEPFFRAHPDWIAVDATGEPYRAGELYVTCINSPYYSEYLPSVLEEIIERTQPDGFGDNSYSGLDRGRICHCGYCREKFHSATGLALPEARDWDDGAFRAWIDWSYSCRVDVWDLNNRTVQNAGGENCLWIGMSNESFIFQSLLLRDSKAVCERARMILLDSQARDEHSGFQKNAESGKLLHGLLGWDKIVAESMAMYQQGPSPFRLASKQEAEARMWVLSGFAGTIQPWWHHIGAYHEDRRQYKTAEPLFRWHEENESYLVDRTPVANVGVAWSQRNVDFYGRDNPMIRVGVPWQGITEALRKSRIPYLPIHIDHLRRDGDELDLLILPNLGVLSDEQCAAVEDYVSQGGSLLATGETGRFDRNGDPRGEFALAELLGVRSREEHLGSENRLQARWDDWTQHSYLRLHPELRRDVYGPKTGSEPEIRDQRHAVLEGFEETDILPFGGRLELVEVARDGQVPLTFVDPLPVFPPETVWADQPESGLAALVLRESRNGSRIAYLAADIDRLYGRHRFPDHANLLGNIARWTLGGTQPVRVHGPGEIDVHPYHQPGRMIVHLLNLTNTLGGPIDRFVPVGPLSVDLELREDVAGETVRSLVTGEVARSRVEDGRVQFHVDLISDHEVFLVQ